MERKEIDSAKIVRREAMKIRRKKERGSLSGNLKHSLLSKISNIFT